MSLWLGVGGKTLNDGEHNNAVLIVALPPFLLLAALAWLKQAVVKGRGLLKSKAPGE